MKRITPDSFRNSGMRGFTSVELDEPRYLNKDFTDARDTGAKFLRLWFVPTLAGWQYVLSKQQLDAIDNAVEAAQDAGIYLVLCLGLRNPREPFTADIKLFPSLVGIWSRLAKKYKGLNTIAALDVFHEGKAEDRDAYYGLTAAIVMAVQAADATRVCWLQFCGDGSPLYPALRPEKALPGVVYSIHDYVPIQFTHWEMADWAKPGIDYDAAARSSKMEAVFGAADWAERNNVSMVVGEFSALRTRPGAAECIRFSTQIYKARGLSWTYHAWRMADEWNAEKYEAIKVLRQAFGVGLDAVAK